MTPPPSAPFDPLAIPHPLQSTALARPNHSLVIGDDAEWTARELAQAAASTAAALAELGAHSGERIGIWGPATAEWVLACHAISWLGAAVVPLPMTEPEPAILAAAHLCRVSRILAVGRKPLPHVSGIPTHRLHSLPPAPAPHPERFWPLAEPRLILRTSGTTGEPRAVELTTAQLVFGTFGSAIRIGHDPADRWLCCLPLHYIAGSAILWRSAWLGFTVVLHADFDAERVAVALDRGGITIASFTPAMFARVLDSRRAVPFPESLRAVLLGGAPTSTELLDRGRELNAPIALTWGMSETGAQVATRMPGDFSEDSGVGPPLAFSRVVADVDGVLTIRGPQAPNGQFATADVGRVDEDGRVILYGRRDDVINSGGVKIYPAEVEAVLRQHSAVAEVVVFGVPDERWGERPMAVLVSAAGVPRPADAELIALCRSRLTGPKTPDRFLWRREIPQSSVGKISRKELRTWFLLEQADPPQPVLHGLGDRPLGEAGQLNRGMNQLGGGPEILSR